MIVVYQLAKDQNLLETISEVNETMPLRNSNGTSVPREWSKKLYDLADEIITTKDRLETFL